MIAGIYARKSNDQSNTSEDAKSVRRQDERGRAFAALQGWSVDDNYVILDDDISGAEFTKRPGYMRLLNALKPKPPFDVLIVSEVSRLGRKQFEMGYGLKQLAQAGVKVYSYLDGREIEMESAIDKFLLSAMNFAAEIEREKAASACPTRCSVRRGTATSAAVPASATLTSWSMGSMVAGLTSIERSIKNRPSSSSSTRRRGCPNLRTALEDRLR